MSNKIFKSLVYFCTLIFASIFLLAPQCLAWSGNFKVNDIGDRQYIGFVYNYSTGDTHGLGVGCTEGFFQIKIVSDRGPLDDAYDVREIGRAHV